MSIADPRWRFALQLPEAFVATPGGSGEPTIDPPQLLMRAKHRGLDAHVDVHGALLEREVEVRDWLEHSPLFFGREVTAVLDQTPDRIRLDAAWLGPQEPRRGTVAALKLDQRVFVVALDAHERCDDQLLDAVRQAAASFEPEVAASEPFAEPMISCGAKRPTSWLTLVPSSWLILPGTHHDGAASFQAENRRHTEEVTDQLVGKLAFAVVRAGNADKPRQIAELYLGGVREHGLDIGPEIVDDEGSGSWLLQAPVWGEDLGGEVRCRVVRSDDLWLLGGVLGPTRDDDPQAWMQNRRALDVTTTHVRFSA